MMSARKRIGRSALCLLLCLLFILQAAALGTHSPSFTSELEEMHTQYGLIPESLLSADLTQPITRGEMCQIALIAYTKLTSITHTAVQTDHFTDTNDPVICAAFELGIVNGYPNPDGSLAFGPNDYLTREQFCKILFNFSQLLNTKFTDPSAAVLDSFGDKSSVGPVYDEAVRMMVHLSVMRGAYGDNQILLLPQSSATREQALVLFFRYYKTQRMAYAMQIEALENHNIQFMQATDAVSEEMTALVNFALEYLGSKYVWGGTTPSGFDCSGFVKYVYSNFGYTLNRVAIDQYDNGEYVSSDNLMPGDLVFFSNNGAVSGIDHVGIYIGDDQFVHAANSKRGVIISYLNEGYYSHYYIGARRILSV